MVTRSLRISATVAVLVSGILRLASSEQAAPQLKPADRQPIVFGDVVLSNYTQASITFGISAMVKGPQTVVESDDAKKGTKDRLQADLITAYILPMSKNQVERVVAVGSVRYSGSSPSGIPGGVRVIKATAAKGTFHKTKGIIELDGPVTFSGDQPSSDGTGREMIRGEAKRALYDLERRVLVLDGGVTAVVTTPRTPPEGSPFSGETVTVDMSTKDTLVQIDDKEQKGKIEIRIKERVKNPDDKNPDDKKPAGKVPDRKAP